MCAKYNVISVYSLGMYVDPKKKGEMAKKGSLSVLSSPSKGSDAFSASF